MKTNIKKRGLARGHLADFAIIDLVKAEFCECSSVVERDLPKVEAGVRFSSLAPKPI